MTEDSLTVFTQIFQVLIYVRPSHFERYRIAFKTVEWIQMILLSINSAMNIELHMTFHFDLDAAWTSAKGNLKHTYMNQISNRQEADRYHKYSGTPGQTKIIFLANNSTVDVAVHLVFVSDLDSPQFKVKEHSILCSQISHPFHTALLKSHTREVEYDNVCSTSTRSTGLQN